MNVRTKLCIASAAAALIATGLFGGWAVEQHKEHVLDRRITDASSAAAQMKRTADAREIEAAQYREKIADLESQLTDNRAEAAKQDEQIKNQTANTNGARTDVARARGVRSNDATVAELCRKLAALGHKCADK
jgi:ribosomal protein L29